MRIVHVITRLLRAGSEENTVANCLAQAQAGHDVRLLHGPEWDPVYSGICAGKVQLGVVAELVHPIDPRRDVAAVRRLRDLFLEWQPAVVHTHQSKAGIIGRAAARLARVPTVVHGVHILPFVGVAWHKRLVYLTAERALARATHAYINVSAGTRQQCLEHGIGTPDQHFVAHSGMPIERFREATVPADWQQLLGRQTRPPVVLMLAALEERKRHVPFLAAFREALARVPDAVLLLAGEGPYRPAVEAAIRELGLARSVRLLGYHARPEQLIALADLTVLTSLREGLPRVVIQSLAGGRPVVTTDLPGLRDIVRHEVNGLVLPPDGVSQAAQGIADLLLDRPRLEALQRGARATDVSSWSTQTMCRDIEDIYRRIMPPAANTAFADSGTQ